MSSALSSSICYAVVALIVVFSSRGRLYERVRQQQVMSSPVEWTSFQTVGISFLLWWLLSAEIFNMGRGRIENKRVVENNTSWPITFCMRRNGLLKKAYDELFAVLCYAVVALIVVFSSRRVRLYERVRQQVMSSPMNWMSFRTLLVGYFLVWSILPVESVISDWEFYCGKET